MVREVSKQAHKQSMMFAVHSTVQQSLGCTGAFLSGNELVVIVLVSLIASRKGLQLVKVDITCPKSRLLGASDESSTRRPSAPSICKLSCTA